MTFRRFYFETFEKAASKEETIVFPAQLLRILGSPLFSVLGPPAHRGRLVYEFLDSLGGLIAVPSSGPTPRNKVVQRTSGNSAKASAEPCVVYVVARAFSTAPLNSLLETPSWKQLPLAFD